MQFYGAEELIIILGVSKSHAYKIIKDLVSDLAKIGKLSPKPGKIQKLYFCERFMLDPKECDKIIQKQKKEAV